MDRVYSFCLQLDLWFRDLGSPETGIKLDPVESNSKGGESSTFFSIYLFQ